MLRHLVTERYRGPSAARSLDRRCREERPSVSWPVPAEELPSVESSLNGKEGTALMRKIVQIADAWSPADDCIGLVATGKTASSPTSRFSSAKRRTPSNCRDRDRTLRF